MPAAAECSAVNRMSNLFAVVPDANVLIAPCAKETDKLQTAETAFEEYTLQGYEFFAPSILVAEVIFVLCQKLAGGLLSQLESDEAIDVFTDYLKGITPAPNGEASLLKRAVEIRDGYGCSRSSELATTYDTEIVTFDKGFINQAAKNAPTVKVNLLII
jgi:predicted nucleic acid-binding protein